MADIPLPDFLRAKSNLTQVNHAAGQLKPFSDGLHLLRQGLAELDRGPMSYYLSRLLAAYELLLTRYAPFKVGEQVMLDAAVLSRYGWPAGARPIVTEIDIDADGTGLLYTVKESDSAGSTSICVPARSLVQSPTSDSAFAERLAALEAENRRLHEKLRRVTERAEAVASELKK